MNIPVMKREHFQKVKLTSTGPRAHIGMMLKHGKTKKEATTSSLPNSCKASISPNK